MKTKSILLLSFILFGFSLLLVIGCKQSDKNQPGETTQGSLETEVPSDLQRDSLDASSSQTTSSQLNSDSKGTEVVTPKEPNENKVKKEQAPNLPEKGENTSTDKKGAPNVPVKNEPLPPKPPSNSKEDSASIPVPPVATEPDNSHSVPPTPPPTNEPKEEKPAPPSPQNVEKPAPPSPQNVEKPAEKLKNDVVNNWPVPKEYMDMPNPVKADKESIALGKSLYKQHCASCHGKSGLGDGPKAAQLETSPGDFSEPAFQSQSDGALYYKIRTGREDMPSFRKKLSYPEDIWSIVNYLRTLK